MTGSSPSVPGPSLVQQYQGAGEGGGGGGKRGERGGAYGAGGSLTVSHITVCRQPLELRINTMKDISMRSHSNQESDGGERNFPGEF